LLTAGQEKLLMLGSCLEKEQKEEETKASDNGRKVYLSTV